jgi:hypothetical protein
MRDDGDMTERKPAGVGFESWIDAQIRDAQERGAFENLPGVGKPIPDLDQPYDPNRWVKQQIREEGLPTEALLPPSLRLRKELEQLRETVRDLPTEHAVRDAVADLNGQVAAWLRTPSPPYVPVRRANADEVVERWRADRGLAARQRAAAREAAEAAPAARRARWWHVIRRSTAR